MSVNEANIVIDNICSKIGIGFDSAKEFIPMFSDYMIKHSIFWMIFCLIFVIALLALIIKLYKRHKNLPAYQKSDNIFFIVCVGLVATCFTIGVFYNLYEIFEWSHFPEIMSVKYILSML